MKKDLWDLDIKLLRMLYQEETKQLEQALINGAAWEDVTEQRMRIGELFTIIYKKSNPAHFGHPAENASRKNEY